MPRVKRQSWATRKKESKLRSRQKRELERQGRIEKLEQERVDNGYYVQKLVELETLKCEASLYLSSYSPVFSDQEESHSKSPLPQRGRASDSKAKQKKDSKPNPRIKRGGTSNNRLINDKSTRSNVKKNVSDILIPIAEVFTPPPDDGDQEAIVTHNEQPLILNKLQAAIYAISQGAATFLTDPEGEEKQYEEWLGTFNLKSHQTELSDLLVNNQLLKHNYTALVPAQVSHEVFWHRYFYKVSQLEAAEAQRQELTQQTDKSSTDSKLVQDNVWKGAGEFEGSVCVDEIETVIVEPNSPATQDIAEEHDVMEDEEVLSHVDMVSAGEKSEQELTIDGDAKKEHEGDVTEDQEILSHVDIFLAGAKLEQERTVDGDAKKEHEGDVTEDQEILSHVDMFSVGSESEQELTIDGDAKKEHEGDVIDDITAEPDVDDIEQ